MGHGHTEDREALCSCTGVLCVAVLEPDAVEAGMLSEGRLVGHLPTSEWWTSGLTYVEREVGADCTGGSPCPLFF